MRALLIQHRLKPLILAILLTITTPATAAVSTCADIFATITTPLPVQLFLFENTHRRSDRLIPEMKVAGTLYRDLIWLGKGRQGQVFRAQSANGLVAVKAFHTKEAFEEGLGDYARYKRWLPKLIAVDKKTNTLVIEYREGLSVRHILLSGENYGITETEKDRIRDRWELWVAEQKQIPLPWYFRFARRPSFLDLNVIYSFRDDTFYMIDVF